MSTPHHRRSIRLKSYDYSYPGAYFITLLVHQRQPLFGSINNVDVNLTTWGRLAEAELRRLPARFPGIEIDAHIVMPDHLHAIIWITDSVRVASPGARHAMPARLKESSLASPLPKPPSPGSLGAVIGTYKATTTRLINGLRHTPGAAVWQRNYYEHIIRDDREYGRVYDYILSNPLHADDAEDPFR